MSNNYLKTSFPVFDIFQRETESISGEELDRIIKLDRNIQSEIKRLKDCIYEMEALHKNCAFINKEWLEESIANYEKRIRELERYYK
jgi:hypothetical protein